MNVSFFTVLRSDPVHFLHAASLVREIETWMPSSNIVQFTDDDTPVVPGVRAVVRGLDKPLLELRLELYCKVHGQTLFVDTDVSVRADVRSVFSDEDVWDVALCDRAWPHLPQGDSVLQAMPFNTGVVFCQHMGFWPRVLETWRGYDESRRRDWMSEQWAVWEVVRSGSFRVKILPGMVYNYPPMSPDDAPGGAKLLHYKGQRKSWLTQHAERVLSTPALMETISCV